MASLNVGNLGEYLREQRRNAQLSLRQLADAAGVSNPYLSQIERGLRKPSAEVLQQVAKALRISAETLYVRAGILDAERDREEVETRAVILADPTLSERQKQVLLQIYESFRKENGFGGAEDGEATGTAGVVGVTGAVEVAQEAETSEVSGSADGSADGSGGSDGGSAIRRGGRKAGGGTDAGRRGPSGNSTSSTSSTSSDIDPQQTAD
ncbi:helix-turn-helix transcriptional regulator [Streptomyces sp. M2CJ-2]|uniref:helix-turn-helix domain-containing protein n=1 Tax=Streptomyces sp. M2CJ-2 TaxID=2803948 RepID=UPI0019280EBC|nr:helix-turn-helix transcriptional regulator [Streptomyces sp. M2CJ-2]MBL3668817.1 helix-turn-helix transcriptional regulator [Streptomyces sp. M2CJ-2]